MKKTTQTIAMGHIKNYYLISKNILPTFGERNFIILRFKRVLDNSLHTQHFFSIKFSEFYFSIKFIAYS